MVLFLSIYLFGILKSTQARIMFGWSSSLGTFENLGFRLYNHRWAPCDRLTGRHFLKYSFLQLYSALATISKVSVSSTPLVLVFVLQAQPQVSCWTSHKALCPSLYLWSSLYLWKRWCMYLIFYQCLHLSSSSFSVTVFTWPGILDIRSSFSSAKDPSSLIRSIPNPVNVVLLMSGGEFIPPFTKSLNESHSFYFLI